MKRKKCENSRRNKNSMTWLRISSQQRIPGSSKEFRSRIATLTANCERPPQSKIESKSLKCSAINFIASKASWMHSKDKN